MEEKQLAYHRKWQKDWRRQNPDLVRAKKKKYYDKNKEHILVSNKRYKSTIRGHCTGVISKAKISARDKNLPFDLDTAYLELLWKQQGGLCSLTNEPMNIQKGKGRTSYSASLDKIKPNKGYIKGNVRWVCFIVNIMKSNLSDRELKKWCWAIVT